MGEGTRPDVGSLSLALAYWRDQLAGAPVLDLPTSQPRPAVPTYRIDAVRSVVEGESLDRYRAGLAMAGVTPATAMLGVFELLLARYSGQNEVVVVVPPADCGAMRGDGGELGGMPIRIAIDDAVTVRDLFSRIAGRITDGIEHTSVSTERIAAELGMWYDAERGPALSRALFRYRSMESTDDSEPNREVQASLYDLTLGVRESDGSLELELSYAADLYEREFIERCIRNLITLLDRAIISLDEPALRVPLLSDVEHDQLAAWNATAIEYPAYETLHGLVEAQVARTPDAPAVTFRGHTLTYRELDDRANRLASALRDAGVSVESPVGVFMERSLEMVVSLLAILKAGGAYVPMDPEYPAGRLEAMLEDSRAPIVLTQEHLRSHLPSNAAVQLLSVDVEWDRIAANAPLTGGSGATRSTAAYIIFTSGSTGRPKGVVNTHDGICNRLLWMQDAFRLGASDVVLQKTPYSFDVSVWEFFWPLLTGAQLAVAEPGGHRDPQYLIDVISRERVTTIHFVPSMLQAFLDADIEQCISLRRVICSGEALPASVAATTHRRLKGSGLHNLYGPTEAAVDVTWWECTGDEATSVPIGRPIANTRIHILDRFANEVPIGVAGELHIGGVQVARGYVNRPELTAERFIPDPFSAGGTLYRTGDLATWRVDGAVEYLGRLDHQVKIRGLRIELGEIESALEAVPGIRQAVVTARGDAENRQLVAYIVADVGRELNVSDTKRRLGETLPQYMVPPIMVQLESFPLSSNGKVDRKALPDPAAAGVEMLRREYTPPQGPVEEAVAAIWRDLLNVERIGRHDNFFDIGGHSLMVGAVASRLRDRFGEFNVADMFQHVDLAGLAASLDPTRHGADTLSSIDTRAAQQRASRQRQRRLITEGPL